jgi:succinyl-diaminopimelate desuccinylase
MKSGIAAILMAVKSVLKSGIKLRKGLTVALCSDEEPGSAEGMKYIAEKKLIHGNLAMAADTNNACIQGWFKGRAIYEISTKGKSAHPSNPAKGVNAVHHMGDLVYKINHQGFPHQKHEFLGNCTLNFGFIQGGKDVKSIPEECKSLLEVRMVRGQTVEEVQKQIETYIQEMKRADPHVDANVRVVIGKDPMEIPVENPVFDKIQRASRSAIGRELEWSRAGIGGGDLYFLWKSMGIPGINFGPGDVELAHSPNEYVTLDNLVAVSKCYTAFIVQFCEGYLE